MNTIQDIQNQLKTDVENYTKGTRLHKHIKEAMYWLCLGYAPKTIIEDLQIIPDNYIHSLRKALTNHSEFITECRIDISKAYLSNGISEGENVIIDKDELRKNVSVNKTNLKQLIEDLKPKYIDLLVESFNDENETTATRKNSYNVVVNKFRTLT